MRRRPVNNHNKIKEITNQVGASLGRENLNPIGQDDCAPAAEEVVVQVDGGHLPIQEKDKRSFEALSVLVYRPESIREIDNHHREIEDKSCAMSALDDELVTIKTYVLNAAHKQGMTQRTKVTALADGTANCWSVVSSLAPHCQQIESILDWFHIGKKFQTVKNALGDAFEDSLVRAKWKLWHGKVEKRR